MQKCPHAKHLSSLSNFNQNWHSSIMPQNYRLSNYIHIHPMSLMLLYAHIWRDGTILTGIPQRWEHTEKCWTLSHLMMLIQLSSLNVKWHRYTILICGLLRIWKELAKWQHVPGIYLLQQKKSGNPSIRTASSPIKIRIKYIPHTAVMCYYSV